MKLRMRILSENKEFSWWPTPRARMVQKLECSVKAGPMQRETTIPGKKSESFEVEQHPWSLIGIVPQGRPDRRLSIAIERQLSCSNHVAVYSLGSHHAASRY